ncbi:unnamed protein product [Hermetia illucens]|uniref:Uncharacterized protein n=1 Tax=Hermetia illucens TaxID=343691 RepID=A0A7R8YW12_HERIL|nr:unnamed protein product [Hermetia illucens]
MREIIAATNSPNQKLTKWLVSKLSSFVPESKYMVRQKPKEIANDEMLISFLVKAVLPSTPEKKGLCNLEDSLLQEEGSPE